MKGLMMAGTIIRLYRGDFEKIDEFKLKKTHNYSLVGPGIYLTNDEGVAHSYRTKGAHNCSPRTYFHGEAKNRTDALEHGFKHYAEDVWYGTHMERGDHYPTVPKLIKRHEDTCREKWQQLVDEGIIVAEYVTYKTTNRDNKSRIVLEVRNRKIDVGYTTTFEFSEAYLNGNVIHLEKAITDESFWGLMYDNSIGIGTLYSSRESFIKHNKYRRIYDISSVGATTWIVIKELLIPYGIIGFEYPGGVITANKKHRAFCLWDENWVNAHKVKRVSTHVLL